MKITKTIQKEYNLDLMSNDRLIYFIFDFHNLDWQVEYRWRTHKTYVYDDNDNMLFKTKGNCLESTMAYTRLRNWLMNKIKELENE